jgi:hypothetical protein
MCYKEELGQEWLELCNPKLKDRIDFSDGQRGGSIISSPCRKREMFICGI